jgi:hypothetical protein
MRGDEGGGRKEKKLAGINGVGVTPASKTLGINYA